MQGVIILLWLILFTSFLFLKLTLEKKQNYSSTYGMVGSGKYYLRHFLFLKLTLEKKQKYSSTYGMVGSGKRVHK